MNILILVFSLTIFTGYMILVFDQNRLLIDTINSLYKSKQQSYELEGAMYYAMYYYKQNNKKISLPHKLELDKFNNLEKLTVDFGKLDKDKIHIKLEASYEGNIFIKSCILKWDDGDLIINSIK